jgi:hypothetical protein|tara:strand:+ start:1171 stop:1380 length:210 start_codon:yes stop_codon:yes gene_type:complete
MKTIEDLKLAKEDSGTIDIKMTNGKTMIVDFYNNIIMRWSDDKGVEATRDFYSDKPKMYNLALTYLNKQ